MAAPAVTTQLICTHSLRAVGATPIGSDPDADDLEAALDALNRIFRQWNVREKKAFFKRAQAFTFSASQASYSIGTAANGADFVVTSGERPYAIDYAQLVLTDQSPNVYLMMNLINTELYQQISVPQLPALFPLTLYYVPGWPNGTLYPYPTFPTATSYQLNLTWANQFDTIDIADITAELLLPSGSQAALEWTLAEELYVLYPGRSDINLIAKLGRKARADWESPNSPPKVVNATDGVQPNRNSASSFNWISRQFGS